MFGGRRKKREEELAAADRWRTARRLVDEDVTVLGEQLSELHIDTLADHLDSTAQDHYKRALEHYDQAKHLLSASETARGRRGPRGPDGSHGRSLGAVARGWWAHGSGFGSPCDSAGSTR